MFRSGQLPELIVEISFAGYELFLSFVFFKNQTICKANQVDNLQ